MIKKIIFSLLLAFFIVTASVSASTTPLVKVGNRYYDTLEEAIANASIDDTITLISTIELDDTIVINKVVNLDLNGNDILAKEKVFEVSGGFLTLTGKGTIRETKPNYGAIMLTGSAEYTDEKYSAVNVGKDVTLEGWSGIFISHESSKSYGVSAYLEGKINAVDDINGGSGVGVYVNGNIRDPKMSPVVNIMDGAEITSTGNGLYIAGYSTFNIGKAYISGTESGIGIKSGILNIDGATVVCGGKDNTPTEGYNNGIKPSGSAIQIESNSGYAGDIVLNISSGNFKSKNSNVIYEYIGKGSNSTIYSMSISGGAFISESSKNVFSFSNSFKEIHSGFISGGQYSSDPSEHLKSGYTTSLDNGIYSVTKSTIKEVVSTSTTTNNNKSFIEGLITFFSIILFISVIYFNRTKLFNILKKIYSFM